MPKRGFVGNPAVRVVAVLVHNLAQPSGKCYFTFRYSGVTGASLGTPYQS